MVAMPKSDIFKTSKKVRQWFINLFNAQGYASFLKYRLMHCNAFNESAKLLLTFPNLYSLDDLKKLHTIKNSIVGSTRIVLFLLFSIASRDRPRMQKMTLTKAENFSGAKKDFME
uniref:Uncharacterized protein n=1 Tax=Romanomermis culicivorax TaxID=13658 RepID=A0A915J916_ROMCU